ncbi:hypothetical protein CEXT_762191 [Caerostris extrusa]|uniref:Uncharacterized protein n=1 Tax=Caerostris extrusa TaxID=172846 RepID=A0AAV4P1V9_CAEEX|nr:hypothetical protein CEXT_762191 [Caerostris extrusa]
MCIGSRASHWSDHPPAFFFSSRTCEPHYDTVVQFLQAICFSPSPDPYHTSRMTAYNLEQEFGKITAGSFLSQHRLYRLVGQVR